MIPLFDDALQEIASFLTVTERLLPFSLVCRRFRDVAALDIQRGTNPRTRRLVVVHAAASPHRIPGIRWTAKGYPYTTCVVPGDSPQRFLFRATREGDATVFCTLWRGLSWTWPEGDACWDIVCFETLWRTNVDVNHVRAILAVLAQGSGQARVWRHGLACLKSACMNGLTEIVRFFVEDLGVSADALDGTLLYLTVPQHPGTAAFLASRGADITRAGGWVMKTLHAHGLEDEAELITAAWARGF